MSDGNSGLNRIMCALLCMQPACFSATVSADAQRTDYLSLSQGAIPVARGGAAEALKVETDPALRAIDGDMSGYGLTPKPGGPDTQISLVYQLPALTSFESFAVPNILETPSPSQTFFRNIEIGGSDDGPDGPFHPLASEVLETHTAAHQVSEFPAAARLPVRWIRLTLSGGIDVQRDKTFFEFSEILGYGHQEPVPQLQAFTGKWKGRGVLLELKQDEVRVSGCYDRVGDLSGTVDGNLLRATGKSRDNDIPSVFVLTVTDQGAITGVRSTNGAPFRLYTGDASPGITTECSEQAVAELGCGSIIHGLHFDYDSAVIQSESDDLLDELAAGLKAPDTPTITVIGHTSSEGSDAYNDKLSQQRANAVVSALVARGMKAATISAVGRGEREPIADNATGAGRELNRRVEIACQ